MKKKKMKIRLHKDHIRSEFKNLSSLKKSIKKDGLVEPIIVDEKGNIVGGARRFKALNKRVKQSDIRVVPTKDLLKKQLIMELHRSDLNPMDLARALDKYKKRTKQSGRKCAKDLGIGYTYFRRMRKMVDLPIALQNKIYNGEIAPNSLVVRETFKKRRLADHKWKKFNKAKQYHSIINSINSMRTRIETSDLDIKDLDTISDRLTNLAVWVKFIGKSRKENGK